MPSNFSEDSATPNASIDYISAAANRYARTAHASDSSLVAFGSSSSIALWSANEDGGSGINQALPGHEGLVTCVQFKPKETIFFSTDDRGYIRRWRLVDGKWRTTCVLQAHSKSITAIAVHENYVATGSSDASIAVWKHSSFPEKSEEGDFGEIQRIDMKGRYPLDIQIVNLPESDALIMAVSGTERDISIFVQSEEKFIRAASLPGHEGWVKSLSFMPGVAGPSSLTLASGSQDGSIRLWNIEPIPKKQGSDDKGSGMNNDLLDSFEASLGEIGEGEEGGRQITMKRHIFVTKSRDNSVRSVTYSITFDALLIGHEAGITSLSWRPSHPSRPMLLSTSTDSSVILWAPTSVSSSNGKSTSLWINQQRFGDIGGQRLGGFVGAIWIHDGSDALAWGWAGGWRRWRSQLASPDQSRESWREVIAVTGHNGPVQSVSWSPGGEYVISTGPDQTTRIHGNVNARSEGVRESWHEMCRPQVHGYDLIDAVFLSPTRFVSIADEKVARVFDAPRSFVTRCKHFGILPACEDEEERPAAASVPPLGLSNKAVTGADSVNDTILLPSIAMTQRLPFEGELATSTLWPEVEKLFGHGYELHAIAASHDRTLIATSCRSTTPEHAGIKLYETKNWRNYGQTLMGHQLTITRIAFSPDDRYILSVSRDRSWCLYERTDGDYAPLKADKSHVRIIWDCAWAHENDIFVTASRDKTVRIWHLADVRSKKQTPRHTIKMKDAATAVALATATPDGRRLMAVGLENGEIMIYRGSVNAPEQWSEQLHLSKSIAHVGQVPRMAWRPRRRDAEDTFEHQLATCSEDGSLRIIRIRL